MTPEEIAVQMASALPRDLVLDLFDVAVARTRQAHELIRDHTDLAGRGARGLEGQARFRLMEKGFQDTCERHGGARLDGDIIPGSDLRYYQPFMRFGGEAGVLLGLASMSARAELPTKNKSRTAGVSLNYRLTARLDFGGGSAVAQPGDIFVLLLFARDASQAGRVEEVAIGVIDAEYQGYLIYEPVETFLARYAAPQPEPVSAPKLVTLKKTRKAFVPPEQPEADIAADDPVE